jgi:hypothetical protein
MWPMKNLLIVLAVAVGRLGLPVLRGEHAGGACRPGDRA